MDAVDSGIKMLVEAITETQYSVDDVHSSDSLQKESPNDCCSQTISAEEGGLTVSAADISNSDSADCSITDTSSVPSALPNEFESPAKAGNNQPSTPLTPTANLKMLVAAASSALDMENASSSNTQNQMMSDKDEEGSSRKMKSLALLCKRFLQVADQEIGPGKEFSLEMIATSLGINRRRIYDIINVMEALEMISKQSKNWYLWHGQSNLVATLAKLKAMAVDDPDIQPYLDVNLSEENNKENEVQNNNNIQDSANSAVKVRVVMEDDDDEDDSDIPAAARSVRYDKSLGVLCQKFVMLFLISACTEITLEEAGKILVPDYHDDSLYMALNPPVNPKTKVRRLYDIANILSSLGLIKKKVFVGPHHIKKPGYAWSGPSLADIEAISVARKNEYTLNKGLMRRSISSRPYLHQYEVQIGDDTRSSGSAPASPAKTPSKKFKRSLSFGGGGTADTVPKQSTVVARPLCPKQVDYLREMKEFETEMQKHSHRYPHVASIFHEFLQKYQTTMEQTASANGRFILPKAAPTPLDSNNIVLSQMTQQPVSTSLPAPEIPTPPPTSDITPMQSSNAYQSPQSATTTSSTDEMPPSAVSMPSCRFETVRATGSDQPSCNIQQQMPLKCLSSPPDIPRESCAVREKQKALERLVLKPGIGAGSPYHGHTPIQSPGLTSVINIPTSTLVTNLANSILVNVLQNNILEAAAGNGNSPVPSRGTIPVNQPGPLLPVQKPGFIHVDDLLVKPLKEAYLQSGQHSQFNQAREDHHPIRLGTQHTIPSPSLKANGTHSTVLFNPNHFLTTSQAAPPSYSQCSTVLCQPTSLCVKSYADSHSLRSSPPKRPRLE